MALARPDHWDAETVRAWLREAADTLRRLPDRELAQVRGRSSYWPEIMAVGLIERAHDLAHGETVRLGPPEPGAIDRLDEVIGWLSWLPIDWRRITWSRAAGVPVVQIARRARCDRRTAYRVETRALRTIVGRLNS